MTWQSGGGGGIPGLSSDNRTPGGAIIAGALNAGDPDAATVPSFINLNGAVSVNEVAGNQLDFDSVLSIFQQSALVGDSSIQALYVNRDSTLNGHNYLQPMAEFDDSTASTGPLVRVKKGVTVQFQVDGDGVVVHGKLKTGASVAHTLGAFSGNAVPIYDEAGTLLGYMPLYA